MQRTSVSDFREERVWPRRVHAKHWAGRGMRMFGVVWSEITDPGYKAGQKDLFQLQTDVNATESYELHEFAALQIGQGLAHIGSKGREINFVSFGQCADDFAQSSSVAMGETLQRFRSVGDPSGKRRTPLPTRPSISNRTPLAPAGVARHQRFPA